MTGQAIQILLIDDGGASKLPQLVAAIGGDFELQRATNPVAAVESMQYKAFDLAIIDSVNGNGLDLLNEARRLGCPLPIILVTLRDAHEAIEAIHNGAADCLIRDELTGALLERSICLVIARAQAALEQDEFRRRYLALIENADEIIYTCDLEGNFTSTNRLGELSTGYSQEETLHLNVLDVVAPEHTGLVRHTLRRMADEQKRTCQQFEIIAKDGRRLALKAGMHLIYHDGAPVGIQAIAHVVTDKSNNGCEAVCGT
jgi:PAS domain S-box-containing protein